MGEAWGDSLRALCDLARSSMAEALHAESLLWSSARDGRQPPLVVRLTAASPRRLQHTPPASTTACAHAEPPAEVRRSYPPARPHCAGTESARTDRAALRRSVPCAHWRSPASALPTAHRLQCLGSRRVPAAADGGVRCRRRGSRRRCVAPQHRQSAALVAPQLSDLAAWGASLWVWVWAALRIIPRPLWHHHLGAGSDRRTSMPAAPRRPRSGEPSCSTR